VAQEQKLWVMLDKKWRRVHIEPETNEDEPTPIYDALRAELEEEDVVDQGDIAGLLDLQDRINRSLFLSMDLAAAASEEPLAWSVKGKQIKRVLPECTFCGEVRDCVRFGFACSDRVQDERKHVAQVEDNCAKAAMAAYRPVPQTVQGAL